MKAVVLTAYGSPDVLKLSEVEKPTPKPNEVLVRVRATPVNFGDTMARDFKSVTPRKFGMPALLLLPAKFVFGFNKPKIRILGSEFAGDVEAVGAQVTQFKAGDQVFGYRGQNMGANAEYLVIAESGLITHKPANMSYEEAAAVPYGALTALSLLKKIGIQPGMRVLINGASGGIGSYAVQIAKYFGAEVTGVCGTPRLAYVKALGADQVIDYSKAAFTQNGKTYDLIFDIQGKCSFARCKSSLTANGRLLYASFKLKQLAQMLMTSRGSGKKVICALSSENKQELAFIKERIEAGDIKAVIDRRFPLEQTAEAHRYVENGLKQGQVVITVA